LHNLSKNSKVHLPSDLGWVQGWRPWAPSSSKESVTTGDSGPWVVKVRARQLSPGGECWRLPTHAITRTKDPGERRCIALPALLCLIRPLLRLPGPASSTSCLGEGQSPSHPSTQERSSSAITPSTRSAREFALKRSDVPKAACRSAQKSEVKRGSRRAGHRGRETRIRDRQVSVAEDRRVQVPGRGSCSGRLERRDEPDPTGQKVEMKLKESHDQIWTWALISRHEASPSPDRPSRHAWALRHPGPVTGRGHSRPTGRTCSALTCWDVWQVRMKTSMSAISEVHRTIR
jgi:hypothetical protein